MPETTAPAPVMGSAEAAHFLGIDKSTLTRWVADGAIAATRIGDRKNSALIFDRAEVERVKAERAA